MSVVANSEKIASDLNNALEQPVHIPLAGSFQAIMEMVVPDQQHHAFIQNYIDQLCNEHRLARFGLAGLISLLKLESWCFKFSSIEQLSQEQKHAWLSRAEKPMKGLLLKALSYVIKFAYVQSPELHKDLGSKLQLPEAKEENFRWRQQIIQFDDAAAEQGIENGLEVDVIVIGTGAGGAAAAYELASQGLAVLVVEEGEYYSRKDFNGNIPQLIKRLYRSLGLTASIGNHIIPIPIGKNVGGTTTINSGTCLRTPDHVLQQWQQEKLTDMSLEEWDKYYQQVEDILEVQSADARYVGQVGEVIASGANALGLKKTHALKRNATGCDGKGLCQFGCPTDAKRSTNVSYMPRALDAGALLLTSAKAGEIQYQGDQVVGLKINSTLARSLTNGSLSNNSLSVEIKTQHVVVAAGSLITPSYLAQNGIKNSHLGRNLSIHPCGAVTAKFSKRNFSNSQTIPQGFGVADKQHEGLMLEGATPPLMAYGLMQPDLGEAYVEKVKGYQSTAFFGFMIKDTSRGKVAKYQIKGMPVIHYSMNKQDFELFLEGVRALSRIYLAAGAESVEIAGNKNLSPVRSEDDVKKITSKNYKVRDFLITAYHPLGSAKMSAEAATGVVDHNLQVHGKLGLYVMDGSVLPSSLGANPQMTIMAIATRSAANLGRHISDNI